MLCLSFIVFSLFIYFLIIYLLSHIYLCVVVVIIIILFIDCSLVLVSMCVKLSLFVFSDFVSSRNVYYVTVSTIPMSTLL